jgi:cohesin loading factor subunit SCC2
MSLLNARFIVSARQSFDYQRVISPNNVQGWCTFEPFFDDADVVAVGYRMQPEPTALLQRWYSLVREKRAPRQDFLKALVKAFDIPTAVKSSQVKIRPLFFLYFLFLKTTPRMMSTFPATWPRTLLL